MKSNYITTTLPSVKRPYFQQALGYFNSTVQIVTLTQRSHMLTLTNLLKNKIER